MSRDVGFGSSPGASDAEKQMDILSQAKWAFLQLTQADATWDFGRRGGGGGGKDGEL